MKTYTILGLGLFFVDHQPMAALEGLVVHIDHELFFSDGKILSCSIDDAHMYHLSLESPFSMVEMALNLVQEGIHNLMRSCNSAVGQLFKPSKSKSLTGPSMYKEVPVPHSQVENVQCNTIDRHRYTIGWRLSGMQLKEWIDLKYLFTADNFLYMTAQTYLTHSKGFYYLTWTEAEGYKINLGAHEVRRGTGVCMSKGYFEKDMVLFEAKLTNQKIRIDVDVKAIQIPKAYFKYIEDKLSYMDVERIEGKVRLVSS